jgi:hypothetical protein
METKGHRAPVRSRLSTAGSEDSMCEIRIGSVSKREAAELLVGLYRVLVEQEITSPKLSVETLPNDLLDIRFTFDSVEDWEAIEYAWPRRVNSTA